MAQCRSWTSDCVSVLQCMTSSARTLIMRRNGTVPVVYCTVLPLLTLHLSFVLGEDVRSSFCLFSLSTVVLVAVEMQIPWAESSHTAVGA
jgi:hypothetical protein